MSTSPDPSDVAARLAVVVGRVARRIRPTHGDLSAGHFSTLATIERLGPQRPSDLARIERMGAPAMTRIVALLESRGLLERSPAPDDARSVLLHLTDAGNGVVQDVRTERAGIVAELIADLGPDELRAVSEALTPLERVAKAATER
ncbi:MarR family transcriptional regulator [Luteimicrobium album]|uniref:MarR family transcriptional regulator n=1 Tax=Luteimicrobium album TaxID=1054550 RepID=A0ABQ6I3Y8_9MICO|nr:MarR family transcriptional regulator [Luteimicrobium album]GMA24976.1 MarR family transcriptional regulator [Luteimicrobium album]